MAMGEGSVIVTGGAKRMGAAITRRLVQSGAPVMIHHRQSNAEADALVAELGPHVVAIDCDLAAADAAETLIATARSAFGVPVTGLVNNASLFAYDALPIADDTDIDRHMAVNLTAPVLLICAMADQPDFELGAVVNLLDQKLANLNPDFFSYTCSKVALAGATKMLAQAYAGRIAVNAVAPGLTLPSLDQSEAEFAAVASANLLQRPVGADQVASAVAFLLGARGITGQTIYVDCGQRFIPLDHDVMFSTRRAFHG